MVTNIVDRWPYKFFVPEPGLPYPFFGGKKLVGKNKNRNINISYKKNKFIPTLIIVIVSCLILCFVSVLLYKLINSKINNSNTVQAMYENWNLNTYESYQKVYDISAAILEKNAVHNAARTFHGYSAFILAESENSSERSQELLDEAIFNLRIALLNAKKQSISQIQYMLGRAYFYKNKASSYYYYADLAIKYLNLAQENSYKSDDIDLLKGLSYAQLNETEKSIASFTEALIVRESDSLLYDIAKQYYLNGQGSTAKQYLYRALQISSDENILINSHVMLGQIYTDEKKYEDAQKEFELVLENNQNSADAHYGLGVLYELQGDTAKARSEWRQCIKIQFNHPGATKKLSQNK